MKQIKLFCELVASFSLMWCATRLPYGTTFIQFSSKHANNPLLVNWSVKLDEHTWNLKLPPKPNYNKNFVLSLCTWDCSQCPLKLKGFHNISRYGGWRDLSFSITASGADERWNTPWGIYFSNLVSSGIQLYIAPVVNFRAILYLGERSQYFIWSVLVLRKWHRRLSSFRF